MTRRLILLTSAAWLAFAQQPAIFNAQLRQASAAGGLRGSIQAAVSAVSGPAWVGYAAPAVPGESNNGCCWNDDGRGCSLEGRRIEGADPAAPVTPVRLEGPSHVIILLRYQQGSADKLRVVSPDCPLDAGGLPFYWMANVKPAESVAMLVEWPDEKASVYAIAMHAGAEAEAVLVKLAGKAQFENTRRSALFWLALSRGKAGYDIVSRAAREDPSEKIREHAIFALTQSKQPEAIPEIIRIARSDTDLRVRKQAMFWLGRSKDRRARVFFEEILSK